MTPKKVESKPKADSKPGAKDAKPADKPDSSPAKTVLHNTYRGKG